MSKRSKVIGIIMTYNCGPMLKDTYNNLPKNEFDHIIVVDDGSTDESVTIAKSLGLKTFTHKHGGYGVNIRYGFNKAKELGADYMVEIHGDGQYDPSVIPSALQKIKKEKLDLLSGSRFIHPKQALIDGMPIARFLANVVFSFIDRVLFQIPLTEFYNGFRIYSRNLLENVRFENAAKNYYYSFQILIQAKYNNLPIGEIPVRCNYKKKHTSENFWAAAIHAFETFQTFAEYQKAKHGFKTSLF